MRKRSLQASTWGLAFASALLWPAAHAAPVVIYDGSSAPMAPAWSQTQQGAPEVTTSVGITRFRTKTASGSRTSDTNLYTYATGTNSFIASIRLKAYAVNTHNSLDAGLTFSVGDNFSSPGTTPQRAAMLYIDTGAIGWADDTAAVPNDATQLHEYAIRYSNSQLDVFVDASFDEIVAGTATPKLTRPMVSTGPQQGVIFFGDQTNDPNVDSDFEVQFVKFLNLRLASAPTNLQAIPGNGQVTVNWTAPNNAGPAITKYSVTGAPGGSCTSEVVPPATEPATSCTVTGLTNGTSYKFKVVATNDAGDSQPSAESAPVTPSADLAFVGAGSPIALAHGTVGTAYSASLSVTGGLPPYSFSLSGNLPAGLNLHPATGVISGSPTKAETANFSITVVDSEGLPKSVTKAAPLHTATQDFSISIAAAPVSVAPTPVPTLGEWGLIALSSLLAMFGLTRSRRRHG